MLLQNTCGHCGFAVKRETIDVVGDVSTRGYQLVLRSSLKFAILPCILVVFNQIETLDGSQSVFM